MTQTRSKDEAALQARAREFSQSIVRPRAADIDRTEQQKRLAAELVLAGDKTAAVCITEPGAGSAPSRMAAD